MKKYEIIMVEDVRSSIIIEAENETHALELFNEGDFDTIDVKDANNTRVLEIKEYIEDYNDPDRWPSEII